MFDNMVFNNYTKKGCVLTLLLPNSGPINCSILPDPDPPAPAPYLL